MPTRVRREAAAGRDTDPGAGAGHRWKRMVEEGRYRSAAEIADAENITRSFVNRLLRLPLLAPDIVEAILEGGQPKGMQLEELMQATPSGWEEQHHRIMDRTSKSAI